MLLSVKVIDCGTRNTYTINTDRDVSMIFVFRGLYPCAARSGVAHWKTFSV